MTGDGQNQRRDPGGLPPNIRSEYYNTVDRSISWEKRRGKQKKKTIKLDS